MPSPDSPSEELDCLRCGACCHGDDGWVHVDANDDARVEQSPELARHVVLTRHGGYVKRSLRMISGACAALEKSGGEARCSIYEARPSVCRELVKGSTACLDARRTQGIE